MEVIRINFADFWPGFVKTDNYLFELLSKYYTVTISDSPEILFYSFYGQDYLNYDCVRVFYSAENIRSDFTGCDYAISCDFNERHNHYRFPLYGLYIDHHYDSGSKSPDLQELARIKTAQEIASEWSKKKEFCCMVVSNDKSRKRLEFFERLSKIKHVASGGAVYNNVGGLVKDKLEFIKDYKFVISFENSSFPGYVTEKIIEPLFMNCIPIYWGNPLIQKDFNPKRFLNYDQFDSEDDLINRIVEIDNDDDQARQILSEPIFPNNEVPPAIVEKNIMSFLQTIIVRRNTMVPIARSYRRYVHLLNRKRKMIKSIILAKLNGSFR